MPTKAFPVIKLPLIWCVCSQNQKGKFGWINTKEMWGTFACNKKKRHSDMWQGTKCPQSWREHRRNAVCSDQITTNVKPWWGCSEACAEMWKRAKRWMGTAWLKRKSHFRVWIYPLLWNISVTAKILPSKVFKYRNLDVSWVTHFSFPWVWVGFFFSFTKDYITDYIF